MQQRRPVLIIEGDPQSGAEIRETLEGNGFEVRLSPSVASSLEFAADWQPKVILVELGADRAAELDALQALETWFPEAAVVAQAAHVEKRRESGRIFSFLRKPAPWPELLAQVGRAADFAHELATTRELDRVDRERFRNRLEWLLWRRTRESRRLIDYGVRMVANLRHAISQGEGVGALVVQAEMLSMFAGAIGANEAAAEETAVTVPSSAVRSLEQSAHAVRAWMRSLERFAAIDCATYEPGSLTDHDVRACLDESLAAVERFRVVHGQQVSCDSVQFQGTVLANREALGLALREVFTNAFKYSPAGSTVHVVCYRGSDNVTIGVLNDMALGEQPEDWVEEALLPFARFSNVYDDGFLDEELGLGIGLPVVAEALQQCGGSIFLRTVLDHTRPGGKVKRVMAELVLLSRPAQSDAAPFVVASAPAGHARSSSMSRSRPTGFGT